MLRQERIFHTLIIVAFFNFIASTNSFIPVLIVSVSGSLAAEQAPNPFHDGLPFFRHFDSHQAGKLVGALFQVQKAQPLTSGQRSYIFTVERIIP